MPSGQSRNPLKNFRRKSAGNTLDQQQDDASPAAPVSSFRVLERPDKTNARDSRNRSSTIIAGRPGSFSFAHPHAKSADNLGNTLNRYAVAQARGGDGALRSNRVSAGTNSLSSGFYGTSGSSARHSSSSTLPSSLDADHEPENGELFMGSRNKPPASTSPSASRPETSSSFAAKAGRAFSFGRKTTKSPGPALDAIPPIPHIPVRAPISSVHALRKSETSIRDRSFTESSYASTAKPPRLDTTVGQVAFDTDDDDFGNMFDGISKPGLSSTAPPRSPIKQSSPVSAAQPKASPGPSYAIRSVTKTPDLPSPTLLQRPSFDDRRNSWNSQRSNEQLNSAPTSELGSPNSELFPTAPRAAILSNFISNRGYAAVPERYQSPELRDPRASPTSNSGFLSPQSNTSRHASNENLRGLTTAASRERLAWANERPRADTKSPTSNIGPGKTASNSGIRGVMRSSSPEAAVAPQNRDQEDETDAGSTLRPSDSLADIAYTASLFESSPVMPAEFTMSVGKQRATAGATPKKMTKAQFEQASRQRPPPSTDDKSDESAAEESDDEDEVDKQKQIAAQRRRQEATMSVYRQKMKKVAGGGGALSELPSQAHPSMERSGTTNSLSGFGAPGASSSRSVSPADMPAETPDDNVPLGILQAHGFPSKVRPPSQMPGSQPSYVDTGNGGLPAFARKLPMDPYFGAGLINNAHRESMGFGSSAVSVHGGPAGGQMPFAPPGGLVGVIANEERSRASRRGSHNPVTGGYGPIPLPSSMNGNPAFPRSGSMMSLNSMPHGAGAMGLQAGFSPPMGPADMASLSTQQQMAQLMQMQTQMMQQMMALQAGQTPAAMTPNPMGGYPFPMMSTSPSMASLAPQNNLLQTPNTADPRRMSNTSAGRPASLAQSRSMSMLQPPTSWSQDMPQQRSRTMGSTTLSNYAGSVHGLNAPSGRPGSSYSPSIAPSERSNVGMPSRYRPVSVLEPEFPADDRRAKNSPSPLAQTSNNIAKPKSTIRLVDRLKNMPKTNLLQRADKGAEDEDDEAGWAEMARKKEALRQKRATRLHENEPSLSDLYRGVEQHVAAN